jgi:hypothetical protein
MSVLTGGLGGDVPPDELKLLPKNEISAAGFLALASLY